ncbi:ATP-binding cassette domain-containing protein [Vibrio sp. SS-MA-C1-2]|uniref:ATP-binding cassette domain-containing protein n=1 Tax=Vibrio sp. SS-MA-C1-2 TaxID=2908646 RepID=UPI0021A2E095|nr:ATP-binding cassette domain-containing protein [Vibrio sp. SS-MA-C1-2]
MTTLVFKMDNVSFSYDKYPLIKKFSLAVNEGEWLSIVGRSGIGKTTLLNLINQELIPSNGVINVTEAIAYLTQHPLLLPWLNVEQNINFVQKPVYPWSKKSQLIVINS